ncbi:MAG: ribosomal L7Ae/L30e/S12e/Gadd45 family protein [Oscillospiraceae bacterium]|nr:ribosomal L7Ae/L30e/S12e/Gadd45 family protein [Oscillospiraceae bacterium]
MDKLFSMLGLARRAGKLLNGRDAVMGSVKKKKAELVLLTADASPRHKQELEALNFNGKTIELPYNMDDIAFYLGKRSCIFALEDKNLSAAIDKLN